MTDLGHICRHRFWSQPLTAATHADLDRALRRLAKSWPGSEALRPQAIKGEDVWAWANRLHREGTGFRPPGTLSAPKVTIGAGSVNRSIYALQILLDIAVEIGAAHHNVARGQPPAGYGALSRKKESSPVHVPPQEIMRHLFTAIETPDIGLPSHLTAAHRHHRLNAGELCRFLAYSGARLGEASRAAWSDDRQTYLIIHGSKSRRSKECTVHMNAALRDLLD